MPRLPRPGRCGARWARAISATSASPRISPARSGEIAARCCAGAALFLDRDGVINVDHGWVGTRERFEWMPGAREAIRAATEAGWHVFVVTNQSGVARGHYDEAAVGALHAWMADEIAARRRHDRRHPLLPVPSGCRRARPIAAPATGASRRPA